MTLISVDCRGCGVGMSLPAGLLLHPSRRTFSLVSRACEGWELSGMGSESSFRKASYVGPGSPSSLHVQVTCAPFAVLPGYRTVDALLQQMFESEIAPEDENPSLEEILNVSPSSRHPRNPSFGNSV